MNTIKINTKTKLSELIKTYPQLRSRLTEVNPKFKMLSSPMGNIIHGIDSQALDDVFELLAWNQGIGFFASEIGPSTLFKAYKHIKNREKNGIEREKICSELMEKFGESNPDVKV